MIAPSPKAEPRIVNADLGYPRPRLIAPTTLGYVYLAAGVSPPGRVPIVLPSAKRRELIRKLKPLATRLASEPGVVDVNVFRAIVAPPTARFSRFLKDNPGRVPIAHFDVMALIRAQSIDDATHVQENAAFQDFSGAMRDSAKAFKQMTARNIRRIGDPPLKDYAIVNWARWDEAPLKHFASMLARPTFWKFVTRNLNLNDAAAMPVYCRRV
jgi:hypothetical protein